MKNIKTISKYDISKLKYPRPDVLKNNFERFQRKKAIRKAMKRSSVDRAAKPRIVFVTEKGFRKVEAHVTEATQTKIAFSGTSTSLPIKAILSIRV